MSENTTDKNWYINFSICNYLKIDDILDLIRLIDDSICIQEKIYGTNINIRITRSIGTPYDYNCETNILCENKIINDYFNFKFKQIENKIKFSYDEYGDKWYISYSIIDL